MFHDKEDGAAFACCFVSKTRKIRYPFLYECIHTPGWVGARMAVIGDFWEYERSLLGGNALLRAVDT